MQECRPSSKGLTNGDAGKVETRSGGCSSKRVIVIGILLFVLVASVHQCIEQTLSKESAVATSEKNWTSTEHHSQRNKTVVTGDATNNKNESKVILDPVERQRYEAKQTLTEMALMEQSLDRVVAFQPDDVLLTHQELRQQMTPLLKRGLIIAGDSTARILYGFIYCLMEGMYHDENEAAGRQRCEALQNSLKEKCGGPGEVNVKRCTTIASFSNDTDFHLQFEAHYHLTKISEQTEQALSTLENGFIYFGMPCLHELWSPGSREKSVKSNPPEWPDLFQSFYSSINSSISDSSVAMIGSTSELCEKKLGNELALIHAFQRGQHLNGSASKNLFDQYNHAFKKQDKLPMNYTGPIPVLRQRANHSFDNALFNDNGAVQCSKVGLDVLQEQKWEFDPVFLDMHNTTTGGCDDTVDGRHYHGKSRLKQVSLILKAFQMYG